MITGLSRMHIQWMLEDMRKKEERKDKADKNFYDYTHREVARALRNYLGQDKDYCVIYYFIDNKSIMLKFAGQCITVFYDQLEKFLQ